MVVMNRSNTTLFIHALEFHSQYTWRVTSQRSRLLRPCAALASKNARGVCAVLMTRGLSFSDPSALATNARVMRSLATFCPLRRLSVSVRWGARTQYRPVSSMLKTS